MKNNACDVVSIRGVLHFECEGKQCDFWWGFESEDECGDMNCGKCMCTEAQNDALTRAAAAINAEQCRRANTAIEDIAALQVAAAINNQIIGAHATVTGGQVVVTSDSTGAGSSIAIGTGTCALTWDDAVDGTATTGDMLAPSC